MTAEENGKPPIPHNAGQGQEDDVLTYYKVIFIILYFNRDHIKSIKR